MEAGLESQDVLALSAEMITGGPSFPSCPLAAIRLQPLPTVSPEETREGEDRILAPNGEVLTSDQTCFSCIARQVLNHQQPGKSQQYILYEAIVKGRPGGLDGKESACSAGDLVHVRGEGERIIALELW